MADARTLALEFWRRMETNDWAFAAELFADGFVLDWPQSGERIGSAENFVAVNASYPAAGRWTFVVHRLAGDEAAAVSETTVSDGAVEATAITFFEVSGDRIHRIREFWPEPYPAPEWRKAWVDRIS